MFTGYIGYGSSEVINVARLMKYVEEGAAPAEVRLDPQVGDYTDLAAVLGDRAYRTAVLDGAPWYDPTNPDSCLFAGLIPLEVTGLDGSTKKRVITERLGAGGTAGTVRAASRPIGVTVLAVAAHDAALDAGLTWLAGVLHPPCAGAQEACGGSPVSLLSSSPAYCDRLPNLDGDPFTQSIVGSEYEAPGPAASYFGLYGAFLEGTCGEVTVSATVRTGDTDDLPDAFGRYVTLDLVDATGRLYATTGAVDLPADHSPVTLTLTVDPSPGFPLDWQPILRWYGTTIIDGGPAHTTITDTLNGGPSDPLDDIYTAGGAGGPWSPGDAYGGTLRVLEWTVTRQPFLTAEECLTGLRRSLRNVVTIDGPTVTEELVDEDGMRYAAKVEWTWVATDPTVYGDTLSLIEGMLIGRPGNHPAVRVATTANQSLFIPPTHQTLTHASLVIDGIPVAVGDRLLLKNQTDTTQNGIYIYHGPGTTLTRASDLNGPWDGEVVGAKVYVLEGTVNGRTGWATTATTGGTFGTTPILWVADPDPATSGYDDGVATRATSIQVAANTEVDAGDTACPAPTPVTVLCGDDPDLPVLLAPPAVPDLADAGMVAVTSYVRRAVQVPPEWSPVPGAALSFAFTNLGATAYRGVRVRLYLDPDPDFGVAQECGYEQEFFITYLPPGETVTIDGPNRYVTTTCTTGLDADHERSMRGAYGGPFAFPELRCGYRYHLTIDLPADQDGEGISVDLAATRRVA